MTWLALVTRIGGVIAGLFDWLKDRRLANRIRAETAAKQLQEVLDAMDLAQRARGDGDDAAGADRLRDNDGHRRD